MSVTRNTTDWLAVRRELSTRGKWTLGVASFLLPLAVWCVLSYVPFVWHPQVHITNPGSVDYFQPGMQVDRDVFDDELAHARATHAAVPEGLRANPVYLPAPHQVLRAFYTAFTTPPASRDGVWLHESLWHSIRIIFWGFVISSAIGVPIGIVCGTFSALARLQEPFFEFFRYLPAPAFGALMVAILGIYDAPKIAIIVIGTFFQQVLIVANTTRKLEYGLFEAALTLGTKKPGLIAHVVVPGILPDLYRDQRILLGWAWTYLIVAELVGTSSGITWYISQQARYQHFDNVYAAILMIGIIGLGTDIVLALLGRRLFPWDRTLKA
ncbi:ABC transporter permease [Burkholderia pyrrocinia]|uniref:ABC transporter permease n=1 Tax=Burkholderia pyrrocinia TaxID=60550 RepID=UPI00064B93DE|nr:ABC transporter permease [Burkholderia pyrrocinia]AKM04975.1 nitrate ABC transporter permease [Burkholderia pyrrocinia]